MLVGQTESGQHRVYLPFDDVDAVVTLGDARTFTRFAVRAAAAGGSVTVNERFQKFATLIGGEIGPEPKVDWPAATSYLSTQPGMRSIVLQKDLISISGRTVLRVEPITAPEEAEYEKALPRTGRNTPRPETNGAPSGPPPNGGLSGNGAGPGVTAGAGAVPGGTSPVPVDVLADPVGAGPQGYDEPLSRDFELPEHGDQPPADDPV